MQVLAWRATYVFLNFEEHWSQWEHVSMFKISNLDERSNYAFRALFQLPWAITYVYSNVMDRRPERY